MRPYSAVSAELAYTPVQAPHGDEARRRLHCCVCVCVCVCVGVCVCV